MAVVFNVMYSVLCIQCYVFGAMYPVFSAHYSVICVNGLLRALQFIIK